MKRIAAILLVLVFSLIAGCGGSNMLNPQHGSQPINNDETSFKKIMARKASPDELIAYANDHISALSRVDASRLVLRLEDTQQKQIESRTEKLLAPDVQTALQQFDYNSSLDDMIKAAQDKKLKDMLIDTRANGFKLIPLEGNYYPIVNYQVYEVYQPYVADDIKAYIDIAASESEQVSLEDAALVISWPELAERTLRAEAFIKKFPASVRIDDVRKQYDIYIASYLYGANNTPAFDYETRVLDDKARRSYVEMSGHHQESKLAQTIKQYLPVLERNHYKRTPEVDDFLKKAETSLKASK